MCSCLPIFLSSYLLVFLSSCIPAFLPLCLLVFLSASPPLRLSAYLLICLSAYLLIYLSTYLLHREEAFVPTPRSPPADIATMWTMIRRSARMRLIHMLSPIVCGKEWKEDGSGWSKEVRILNAPPSRDPKQWWIASDSNGPPRFRLKPGVLPRSPTHSPSYFTQTQPPPHPLDSRPLSPPFNPLFSHHFHLVPLPFNNWLFLCDEWSSC
jgi:hypothetical protein